jgi:hypothetical protein
MLTIKNILKLQGLELGVDTLRVQTINEFDDRYSIWLSNRLNIELDREPHYKNGHFTYYKIHIGTYASNAMTEFVLTDMFDTVGKMRDTLVYMIEKYITK